MSTADVHISVYCQVYFFQCYLQLILHYKRFVNNLTASCHICCGHSVGGAHERDADGTLLYTLYLA